MAHLGPPRRDGSTAKRRRRCPDSSVSRCCRTPAPLAASGRLLFEHAGCCTPAQPRCGPLLIHAAIETLPDAEDSLRKLPAANRVVRPEWLRVPTGLGFSAPGPTTWPRPTSGGDRRASSPPKLDLHNRWKVQATPKVTDLLRFWAGERLASARRSARAPVGASMLHAIWSHPRDGARRKFESNPFVFFPARPCGSARRLFQLGGQMLCTQPPAAPHVTSRLTVSIDPVTLGTAA